MIAALDAAHVTRWSDIAFGTTQFPFPEHAAVARRMNASIALTAAAAIWATCIPSAAQARIVEEETAAIADKLGGFQTVASPDKKSGIFQALLSYSRLKDGWDGSAEDRAPTMDAIYQASLYLDSLPTFLPTPETSVASDGEVILFWKSDQFFLDVGFRGDNSIVYYGKSGDNKIKGELNISEIFSSGDAIASFLLSFDDSAEMLV